MTNNWIRYKSMCYRDHYCFCMYQSPMVSSFFILSNIVRSRCVVININITSNELFIIAVWEIIPLLLPCHGDVVSREKQSICNFLPDDSSGYYIPDPHIWKTWEKPIDHSIQEQCAIHTRFLIPKQKHEMIPRLAFSFSNLQQWNACS